MEQRAQLPPTLMTIDEFLAWDDDRDVEGRFELHDGRIVKANAERLVQAVVKMKIAAALEKSIRAKSETAQISRTWHLKRANLLTRAKMGQSSDVYAVAIMNDGKVLFAKKEVKVTLGGCGG